MRRARTMVGCRGTALIALLLYATCAAYGGIAPSATTAPSPVRSPAADNRPLGDYGAAVQPLRDFNALLPCAERGLFASAQLPATLHQQTTSDDTSPRELPPAPSSMALVASALATLGAYQGARSLRRLHFGFAPDWYHTGGPVQVAHATPFDLEFGALPLCVFDEPVARPAFAYRIPRELGSRLRSQFLLLTESPRGPPRLRWDHC